METIYCQSCQAPTRYWPAGIGKTSGKPYSEHWTCANQECKAVIWGEDKKKPKPQPKTNGNNTTDEKLEVLRDILEAQRDIIAILETIRDK